MVGMVILDVSVVPVIIRHSMTENTAAEQLLYAHLGEALLVYLLNLDPEQVPRIHGDSSIALSVNQDAVLGQLLLLDTALNAMEQHDDLVAFNWRSRLNTRDEATGLTIGNLARQLAGGSLPVIPEGLTELEDLLIQLAVDTYPALLVKEPDARFGLGSSFSLHGHPLNKRFQEAVQTDSQLGVLFGADSPTTGPGGSTVRSTGQGGGHQLWTFAETLIGSGWRLARSSSKDTNADDLMTATLESLRALATAVSGGAVTVPARVGLTGVLLPDGIDHLDFGWGTLRKADARDEVFVRATSLEGQLTTTTADGENVVINYSGDLVLEVEIPYIVKIQSLDALSPWPEELKISQQRVDEYLENVRLGLLLAFPELKPIVMASWRVMLDPLMQGVGAGWSDVSRTPGLMPLQLTDKQAREWEGWTKRIGEHRIPTIGVAIRRMLAAASERHAPDDVLVDAVIVWENLFGAKAETTLRVTSSLAWLLGNSAEDRRTRQSRYKKIYASRSDVVHGAASVRSEQIYGYSLEAVAISIESLRAIFTTHVQLLDIKTSEDRSLSILHEG
jgi:hypothetical protein